MSYFPEHILNMYFNHYMRTLCVLSMKCTEVDKIQGILGVEVSFQLLGGAAGNGVLHEGIQLRFDDLRGYFERCSHQKIARKIEAALSAVAAAAPAPAPGPGPAPAPALQPPLTLSTLSGRPITGVPSMATMLWGHTTHGFPPWPYRRTSLAPPCAHLCRIQH